MSFFHRPHRALAVAMMALAAVGCGKSDDKKPATQVAAKVNKEELSVHQINSVLQRTQNLSPEQVKQASRQILDRLIDQELLVQQAMEKKLDRDPKVMQAVEAARREILSRAYVEQATAGVAKPGAAEIADFYAKRPELFRERRVYNMREFAIALKPDALPRLQEEMLKAKTFADLAEWLKSENIPFSANTATKSAEQLPLELVGRFHQMKDGQTAVIPTPNGILVVQLVSSQSQPLDEKQAAPFIEQFLTNQRKAEMAANELKNLKAKATIEYIGDFARAPEEAKTAEAAPAAAAALPGAVPQPATGAAPPPAPGAGQFDQAVKGLK